MNIFLIVALVILLILSGAILFVSMKTLGVLYKIVEFVNNYVSVKHVASDEELGEFRGELQ